MPRLAPALTDPMIKAAHKNTAKQLTDGAYPGLYLKLRANKLGQHQWRFDFRSPERVGKDGKPARDTLLLGFYPLVTLADAHKKVTAANALLERGECPKGVKKQAQEATKQAQVRAQLIADGKAAPGTFKATAEALHATRWRDDPPAGWKQKIGAGHAKKFSRAMETYVYPVIGEKHMRDIESKDLLAILQAVENAGKKQMAFNVRVFIDQVYKYAINVDESCTHSPMAKVLASGVITKRPKSKPQKSQVTAAGAATVVQAIAKLENQTQRECLQMMAWVFQRPGNVRDMRWADLDLDAALWTIPSAMMKRRIEDKETGDDHVVPLPKQAVKQLRQRLENNPDGCAWVYRAPIKDQPVGQTAISLAMKRAGIQGIMTPHGFRRMARTMLREQHRQNPDALEAHLAHSNGLATGKSYDEATYLQERAEAVQLWADYLDQLSGANVKALKRAA